MTTGRINQITLGVFFSGASPSAASTRPEGFHGVGDWWQRRVSEEETGGSLELSSGCVRMDGGPRPRSPSDASSIQRTGQTADCCTGETHVRSCLRSYASVVSGSHSFAGVSLGEESSCRTSVVYVQRSPVGTPRGPGGTGPYLTGVCGSRLARYVQRLEMP